MTVAITGSSGFIGSHLMKSQENKSAVIGFDFHLSPFNPWNLISRINTGQRFSGVLHFGANSNAQAKTIEELKENNIAYTESLAIACAKKNIPLIFASSAAIYGNLDLDKISPYAISKKMSEDAIIQIGMEYPNWKKLCLRLSNIFGEGEERKGSMQSIPYKFLMNSLAQKPIEIWSVEKGDNRKCASRDFLYIDDLCRIIIQLQNNKNLWREPAIDIGTGITTSFLEVAKAVSNISKCEILLVDFPISVDLAFYQMNTQANIDSLLKIFPSFNPIGIDQAIENMNRKEHTR